YRKAYYRAFWRAPAACAVREPHAKYTGETRFPLILQNVHRYFFWISGNLVSRSEEHTSELQSLTNLVCRLLLEKKKKTATTPLGKRRRNTTTCLPTSTTAQYESTQRCSKWTRSTSFRRTHQHQSIRGSGTSMPA